VVLSSGVHGVEGFMGSAIQLAWLDQFDVKNASGGPRFVLIHAINPYGFVNLRRCNEDNVDLNRNFQADDVNYSGSSPLYGQFNGLLNPSHPAGRFDTFRLSAIWNVLRYGLPAIKDAVAGGQYDYPSGLFFGGHSAGQSTQIVQANIADWIGDAQQIVHIDFHSGLGKFADYRLLLVQPASDPECDWYRAVFDADRIEPLRAANGSAYVAAGAMGTWLRSRFADRQYHFLTAEFGTYGPLRVLAALRRENQVHHYNDRKDRIYESAKRELLECFCPLSQRWREQVLETGRELIAQASHELTTSSAGLPRSDRKP
jgi:predicted deacylase